MKQLFYIQDDFKEWTDVLGLVLQNFVLEVIDKMSFGDFSGIIFLWKNASLYMWWCDPSLELF